MTNKPYTLIVVLAAIIGAIWYLGATKPPVPQAGSDDIIAENLPGHVATSTPSVGTSTPRMATTTATKPAPKLQDRSSIIIAKAAEYPRAKELVDIAGYINTKPFKLADLIGKKVILIDFWTYSCINCQRTLPYLTAWYQKYKDQGLVIVGVHTPEFDFEKNYNNVAKAVQAAHITYPVVLDNNMGTWDAYNNLYWPHEYLIDIDGFIVHDHIGEGDYGGTEQAIQAALKERAQVLGLPQSISSTTTAPSNVISMDPFAVASPETYFGAERNEYLANGTQGKVGAQTLTIPSSLSENKLYLGGTWNFMPQYAESAATSTTITYQYSAKNLYFVAASPSGTTIHILQDGKPLGASAGADVDAASNAYIKEDRLYKIVANPDYGTHTIEIEVQGSGLQAYTFTFG